MGELSQAFFLGVISGLVTTLLVVVFRSIWLKIIDPWYENHVYKDVPIEGGWECKGAFVVRNQQNPVDGTFKWELGRKGHHVTGTFVGIAGPDQGLAYTIEGVFKNLLLTASYSSKNPASLDRGTVSLMLVNNGRTLTGFCSYYSHVDNAVRSCPYTCERI
jgi:hypothetical protein